MKRAEFDEVVDWVQELVGRRGVKPVLTVEGDAHEIVRRAREAAAEAGWTEREWREFSKKALVGDYARPGSRDCINFVVVTTEYFACLVP